MKTKENLKMQFMQLFAAVQVMIFSSHALASGSKMSKFFTGMKEEAAIIVPVVLLIIAGIGVCFAAVAIISGIIAKKNQRPLEWEIWGVIGGALAIVIPVIILAASGSLTGGEGDAGGALSELNVNY